VTVLARQESGLLSYQSVKKETSRGKTSMALGKTPAPIQIPTDAPGKFVYVFRDGAGTELNRASFEVVGDGNVAGRVERNAELKVSLAKTDYAAGDEIEVAIVAPYSGAGLITIERDKVYAAHWFKATGNSTVERIRLPETVEGNGYVVVSFVRDIASRDIFTSPLSSGAAAVQREPRPPHAEGDARRAREGPARHDGEARLERVGADAARRVGGRRGHPAGRALEDAGSALALLPEARAHRHDRADPRSPAARVRDRPRARRAGGDQDGALTGNLNPFKRRGQPPVAFWSGIMDVPAGPGSVDYAVPDSFNGTLRVVAMAVDAAAIGVTETKALVRGPFVVQPTIPYFAAPGDEVDVTARVTNTLDGSGPQTAVDVAIETSPGLEVVGEGTQKLVVPEGRDAVAKWRLRVTGHPGVGRCTFRATSGTHSARATLEMSIRPASPFQTTVATQVAKRGGTSELPVDRTLFTRDARRDGVRVGESARPRAGARALPRRVPAWLHGAGGEQGVPRAVGA
jgi:uncharacterized protein YfaS (alpha-2-macroglobulin family)